MDTQDSYLLIQEPEFELKVQTQNGKEVFLKKKNNNSPLSFEEINHEFSLQQKAKGSYVLPVLEITELKGFPALIFESHSMRPLSTLLHGSPLDLDSFYALAINLAEALAELHAKSIIHKDIRPQNIFVNPFNFEVKLAGFALASQLKNESSVLTAPSMIKGHLSYISPEQSGRMNRQVDYRTDFYSLGVLFYLLLTGKLPFQAKDSLELIHSHIARIPDSPSQSNPAVPKALSQVVLKLMAKTAELRYQSAIGLLNDLKAIRTGQTEDFIPGQRDLSSAFQIPQKLYGREEDQKILLDTFDRVALTGENQLLLVSGYSGIGKSSLVREVYRPITQRKGNYISGKFDQLSRNSPYAPILLAFEELIKQLLTSTKNEVESWKNKILAVLGDNAKVISSLIPSLEVLIGEQREVVELGPQESKNRFNLLFLNFIKVFADKNHPLVLFLDDLQWADAASLEVVQQLMEEKSCRYLMIICAYRNNEVNNAHPFRLMLEYLKNKGLEIKDIQLSPLSRVHIQHLLADTIHQNREECHLFAEMVLKKTDGNPFFIVEFLKVLYENELIVFEHLHQAWGCNLNAIEQANISDNVVDLMLDKIKKLPKECQDILRIGAAYGNTFDGYLILRASKQPTKDMNEVFWPALHEGLLIKTENRFKFAHDRIQQAAYQLNPETERAEIHLMLARLSNQGNLHEKTGFETANQYILGAEKLPDEQERIQVAKLLLEAGNKAKTSAAFDPALKYFQKAKSLLPENSWTKNYALNLSISSEIAETLHLVGKNTEAQTEFTTILALARTNLDKALIQEKLIHFFTNLGRFQDAYATAREAVAQFGIKLPAKAVKPLLILAYLRTKMMIGKKSSQDLLDLPEIQSDELRMAVRLIAVTLKAAYQIAPPLAVACSIKIAQITLKNGNMEDTAIGWLVFGPIFVGGIVGDRQSGYELGKLALDLIEKYDNVRLRAEVNFVFGYFGNSWTDTVTMAESYWQTAYRVGLESGDLFHTGCAATATCMSHYMRGARLDELLSLTNNYIDFLRPLQNKDFVYAVQGIKQAVLHLQGKTDDSTSWNTDQFDEKAFEQLLPQFVSRHFAHFYPINQIKNNFLLGYYEKAESMLELSDRFMEDSTGMLHSAEHYFWSGMLAAALLLKGKTARKNLLLKSLGFIEKAAKRNPANFASRLALLQASKALTTKQTEKATEYLQTAAQEAEKEGNGILQGLALQMLAELGHKEEALHAKNIYQRYGADALALLVSKKFGLVNDSELINDQSDELSNSKADMLDLTSVLKASEVIFQEIKFDSLMEKLLSVVMENAGADKAALLLHEQDELLLMALAELDGTQELLQNKPVEETGDQLPKGLVQYVSRTGESIILSNAYQNEKYDRDPYLAQHQVRSLMILPLKQKGKSIGVLYLENRLNTGAFTPNRVQLIQMLSSQIAISIENAQLVDNLEDKVRVRTQELQKANEELKEKNIKITSSINYASRIQQSALPALHDLEGTGLDFFMLFMPRDIVSGDFYWFATLENKLVLVVADCTGHGVPGAFMSLLGMESLDKIVYQQGITNPAQILELQNKNIYYSLNQGTTKNDDGMDITVCTFDMRNRSLEFAGAKNSLIIINEQGLQQIKGNPYPIGGSQYKSDRSFSKHAVAYTPGSRFYMFTDGYQDQFGGKDERKYMSKRFRNTLQSIYTLDMKAQKNYLEKEIHTWMQSGKAEQTDDITVMGFIL